MNENDVNKLIALCQKRYDEAKQNPGCMEDFDKYPHLFVLACVMDRQIKAERAWNIPYIIADEIGSREIGAFAAKDEQYYINLFETKKLHRYNTLMAKYFYGAVQRIVNEYDGDASKIWAGNPPSRLVVLRFLEFDGVGPKIATMATNILSRDYNVRMQELTAIDISPDVHVKRIMYRLGLVDCKDGNWQQISATAIINKAALLNIKFPGVFDLLFWDIGKQGICENNKCHAEQCPFGGFCPKTGL